jgi:hypothetical protein
MAPESIVDSNPDAVMASASNISVGDTPNLESFSNRVFPKKLSLCDAGAGIRTSGF